jgi:hypothetical protein
MERARRQADRTRLTEGMVAAQSLLVGLLARHEQEVASNMQHLQAQVCLCE